MKPFITFPLLWLDQLENKKKRNSLLGYWDLFILEKTDNYIVGQDKFELSRNKLQL